MKSIVGLVLACLLACCVGSVVTLVRGVSEAQSIAVGEGILTAFVDSQQRLSFVYCANTACQNKRVWLASAVPVGASNVSLVVDPTTSFPVVAFYRVRSVLSLLRCLAPDCATSDLHDIAFAKTDVIFEGGVGLSANGGGSFSLVQRRVFPQIDFAQVIVLYCSNLASPSCTESVIASGPNKAFGTGLTRDSIVTSTQGTPVRVLYREGVGATTRLHAAFPYGTQVSDILLEAPSNTYGLGQTGYHLLQTADGFSCTAVYSGSNGTGTHPRMSTCTYKYLVFPPIWICSS